MLAHGTADKKRDQEPDMKDASEEEESEDEEDSECDPH